MPEAMVFTAGDDAYFSGSDLEFSNCYNPRWGRFKNRTRPSAGNHEYVEGERTNGVPYFDYFGGSAGDRGAGFYSYTWGNWHIVSLNSNIDVSATSEQLRRLDADLKTNSSSATAKCTLGYWQFGPTAANSAFKTNQSWGVIRFTLKDVGWDSVFVEAGTGASIDSSVGNLCH